MCLEQKKKERECVHINFDCVSYVICRGAPAVLYTVRQLGKHLPPFRIHMPDGEYYAGVCVYAVCTYCRIGSESEIGLS